MTRKTELLFIDPGVSDIPTLLGGLRPEVEAILLDARRPAARQIAEALRGRCGLDAVHIIAHGAPGQVSFSAGEWTAATLERDADELAEIGRALGRDGELRLWCCETGAGETGDHFVDALWYRIGANVAAAKGTIGAAAKGGSWRLPQAAIRPPLTQTGQTSFAGVLPATLTSTGNGERHVIFGRWPAGTVSGTYFVVLNNKGTIEVIGKFIVPANHNVAGSFTVSEPLPAGRYVVGSNNAGPGTITVYNGKWNSSGKGEGAWSPGDFDPAITASLNCLPNTSSNFAGAVR